MKWIPDSDRYRLACKRLAKDLSKFKQDRDYCAYVNNDNRPKETAEAFYRHIMEHYTDLIGKIPDASVNDRIGSPTLYDIGGVRISPGTLRFMKVVGDTRRHNPNKIVEIGAGYGGQCLVYKTIMNVDYTIIDIPESMNLSLAYLKANNVTGVRFFRPDAIIQDTYDLVISDYCISEMDEGFVDYYIDKVIRHCEAGYFTCNSIGVVDYLTDRLREVFKTVQVEDERPATSRHKNLIIHAVGNRNL